LDSGGFYMKNDTITRRKFLKTLGSFSFAMILMPIMKFFPSEENKKKSTHIKEAQFYKQADHLAG